jgi:hypothetical protein
MCGIFGVIVKNDTGLNKSFLIDSLNVLAKSSQSRGKDSSGLCIFNQQSKEVDVYKGPIPISALIKSKQVKNGIASGFIDSDNSHYVFGHARLVTNGTQLNPENNQPVIKDHIIGVHNGIIVNVDKMWEIHSELNRNYEIDTEILFALVQNSILKDKLSLESAISYSVNSVYGTVATAFVIRNMNKFVLVTNNGSLYKIQKENELIYFASENFILKHLEKELRLDKRIGKFEIEQIKPGTGTIIDLDDLSCSDFTLFQEPKVARVKLLPKPPNINIFNINPNNIQLSVVMDLNYIHLNPKAEKEKKLLLYPLEKIKSLRRCTTCCLPATFPFIQFDEKGVCNFCNNFKKQTKIESLEALSQLVDPYRKNNGKPDVLIPFSGGRDSTYVLHTVKKELGLNPIAFTYDWGMVTDLARRNIARICGKLGIENIIIAADIHWKRKNIRKNITAWLKNPDLGMIPLFMAGDKFFFYYTHKVKRQLGIDLEIWGINKLENTEFKTGFAGLPPQFDKKRIYSLSYFHQLKLFSFVGKNLMKSPGYINQSIFDSIGSFASRYFTPKKDYFHFYDYVQWDKNKIVDTIISNYDWENAVDTTSTWRIGDGTASFYNYIYTLVTGFSENDTFRSNQIRDGMLTREKALELVYEENKPRYNSIKWYLDILGMNFEDIILRINKIPRLY